MHDRRGSRFALEVVFLVALAAGLAFADARSTVIAGVMALGWLLVAGVEWAAWRGEPHYSSGLPPRWYVPPVDLPPPRPLEAVVSGYPEARRDEAPTWIAPASLRQELLGGDWPVAAPPEPGDDVQAVDEAWTAVGLPPAPEPQLEPEPQPELVDELVRSAGGVARYSLDPLADEPRRRFGRGGPSPTIDVPARPERPRPLPAPLAEE